MKYFLCTWFIFLFAFCFDLEAISLVYNLRIRRSFQVSSALGHDKKFKWVGTAVPIAYSRTRTIIDSFRDINVSEQRLTLGSLFNIRWIPNSHWFAEVSTGLEKEHLKANGSIQLDTSRFGFDDLVVAAGYNFIPKSNAQFVIYGLAGFPLHNKIDLDDELEPLVGTRFYSVGVGSEFSYSLIQSLPKSLSVFFQNRIIHFFERKWDPILPIGGVLEPGNVIDILFAVRYRFSWNIMETGYNPTFFTDQGVRLSPFQKISSKNFVRHGWYITYTRGFKNIKGIKKPGLVGLGFLLSNSKRFDTQIKSGWLNLTILF